MHKTGLALVATGAVCLALVAGCKGAGEKRRSPPQPSEPPVIVPEKIASPGGVRYVANEEPVNPAMRMPAEPSSAVTGGGSVTIQVSEPDKAEKPEQIATPEATTPPPPPAPVRILPPPGGDVPITLHVDDTDVRKALEMISRQANVNILVSPGVTGKVTTNFENMPLHKALNAITRMCNAQVQEKDGILYVSTVTEARRLEALSLPVRIYHLKYIRANDMLIMIKPLLSTEGGAKTSTSPESKIGLTGITSQVSSSGGIGSTGDIQAGGNLCAGGEILVVTDYEEVLKRVDAAVAEIDIQPIQVMIEAVIVQVELSKGMDLGASFAFANGSGSGVGLTGDGSLINAAVGFTPASAITAATGKMVSGFTGDPFGLKYGFISDNVTGFIKAIESAGETKILAAPRIWVLNKQSAQVHLGKMLGYLTTTTTTTTNTQTVNFISVGTQLRIRPYVSPDGVIRMEIHPERSSGSVDGNGVPSTTVSQVTSNVLMRSGQTMVIGGLIDNQTDQTWDGLPFLSRIPWLGYLFRHTVDKTKKTELIVIITPRICPPGCGDVYNAVGRPETLGLDKRVSQNCIAERRDGKNLYELLQEQTCDAPPDVLPIEMAKKPQPAAATKTR